MGRIGDFLTLRINTDDSEDIDDCQVDLGGGDIRLAPLCSSPGDDSKPLPGDYVAMVGHPGGSGVTAVAYADPGNPSVAVDGERRVYARKLDGSIVSTVYQKRDGSIRLENDRGFIELGANGQCNINGNLTVDV